MNESKLPSAKIKTPANNLDLKEMILSQLKEGVLVFNKKGDVIYSNDKVNDILRINVNDHPNNIREKDLMIYDKHGQVLEKKNWPFIGVLDQEIEFENETVGIENTSQQITWLSLSIHPATTEKKAEKCYVATFSEITDLKKTHEKLKESEMFFNAFMKNSPTMSWVYDDKSRLIYGNPLFLSTVNLTTDDFNKKIQDISSTTELARTFEMRIKQVLSTGKTIIAEDVIHSENEPTRYYISYWFLIQATLKKKLIGCHSINITEKKLSRQELEKANERMNYVASANADAIWDMDIKANTVFRNNSFYTLTGYKQKEVKPTLEWLLDHVHTDDRKNLQENIKKNFASTHTHWQHEYRLKIADGRYLHLLPDGRPNQRRGS
jgi:PAS domain S-box-containing protein